MKTTSYNFTIHSGSSSVILQAEQNLENPETYTIYAKDLKNNYAELDFGDDIKIKVIGTPPSTTISPRIIKPISKLEVEYTSNTRVSSMSPQEELVTQSDSALVMNVAEIRALIPNIELFLYLCPVTTTELIRNWDTSRIGKLFAVHNPEIYQFIDGQKNTRQNSIIQIDHLHLFTASWKREKQTGEAVFHPRSTRAEFCSASFPEIFPELTISQKSQIETRLKSQLKEVQKVMSDPLNLFRKKLETYLLKFQTTYRTIGLGPSTVSTEYEPLTPFEQFQLLQFLYEQEPGVKTAGRRAKFFKNSLQLVVPDSGYLQQIETKEQVFRQVPQHRRITRR